ncbi:MAG: hypothetical protein H6735_27190 [Alphaproteobacteria bacterium]|nr:hypothetical protein [Alphaproteobacteria bacterium]
MSAILFALLAPSAHAESVIEFKTTSPVAIFVDGQQATLTSNLKQRVSGLEPGVHELRVSGMFGKTLYEAEIDIPDGTITTAEWDHGEVKVLGTDWLEEDPEVIAVAEPQEEEPAPVEQAVEEPVEVAAAEPLAIPVEEPPAPQPPPTPVATAPEVKEATALPTSVKPRTLTVQATDGMRIAVVHEGRTLTIVVEDDGFRIMDASGTELALGTE